MASLAGRKWGRWAAKNLFTPVDKVIYRLTGGKRGLSPVESVLLLTTTGRKTGRPRQVPILYLRDGDRFWVMASNYGQEHHPAWSSNLLADPKAHVDIGRFRAPVRARLATDDEKKEKWDALLELYPAWRSYASWTDRSFRLFCLEPVDD
jgi:deazaflavin-dependent oxidoreductase (nitroreductase family)